jgi:CheY-like chemotaxis protein
MPGAVERDAPRILLVDDDRDIGELVTAVLGDEGYEVTTLDPISDETVRAAIGSLEPDCILLDGVEAVAYAEAWATAANVRHRPRPIPTVMFTAHRFDAEEAVEGRSPRSVDAGFTAVLRKPFHIDDLVSTVQRAVAAGVPFNHSERARVGQLSECRRRGDAAVLVASRRRISRGSLQHRWRSTPAGRPLLRPRRRDQGCNSPVRGAIAMGLGLTRILAPSTRCQANPVRRP